jgi:integrase
MHSLRRSFATMLEAAMNAGGRVNPALIASLMGHARGTMALDRYSAGPAFKAMQDAVVDMQDLGIPPEVREALAGTWTRRPAMVRFTPAQAALPR